MKKLAIIPARGGSKRIPKKNIKQFLGKPIIAYSIETAIQSALFDEVMVSTEDHQVAEIAKSFGAQVPFFRSRQKADDHTGMAAIMLEVLEEYEKRGQQFDYLCCIFATAPFLKPEILTKAYETLLAGGCDCVFSALRFSYPIQRAFSYDEKGLMKMIWPENRVKRSQDLPETFHDAGQFYFIKVDALKKGGYFFSGRNKGIILHSNYAHDIDTQEDWEVAEMKYKLNFLKTDKDKI